MRELLFQKRAAVLYAVAMLVGTVGAARADTYFTIADTGASVNSAGMDLNYVYYSTMKDPSVMPGVISSGSDSAYLVDSNAWPISIVGPWIDPTKTDTGRWIGPVMTPMYFETKFYPSATPNAYYVYQTSFYIPNGADLSKILITGTLASDNCTTSIGINGKGLGGTLMSQPGCSTNGDSFSTGHAFEIASKNASLGSASGTYFAYNSFTHGLNTIQFTVFNDDTTFSPNPTGLVVWDMQGIAQGPLEAPEPAAAGLMLAGIAAVAWLRRRSLLPSA